MMTINGMADLRPGAEDAADRTRFLSGSGLEPQRAEG